MATIASNGKRFRLVPRTKVNYGWPQLFAALWQPTRPGPATKSLREALADLFGTQNVLLTASGRGALYLLLKTLPQPRVLVPSYTCKAVVEAAMLAQKQLVFAETERDGFNVDVDDVAAQVGTDCIFIATHQFGIPCKIERLMELCRSAGAFVIEDVAPALGTRIGGRLAGTFGDAAFFSFDSTKLVNVPMKAGFLTVRNDKLFERVSVLAAQTTVDVPPAYKAWYLVLAAILLVLENDALYRVFHTIVFRWRGRFTEDCPELRPDFGPYYRHRMAEWQARIALPQVLALDEIVATRRRTYAEYQRRLGRLRWLRRPPADHAAEWACIRFPVLVPGGKLGIYERAVDMGVDFAFSFTFIGAPASCERAHQVAREVLDLPYYEKLSSAELHRVTEVLLALDSEPRDIHVT